MHDAYLIPVQR